MGRGDTLLNAAIGGVITIGLSFTGFSPLLGGGVAGYLQGESAKVGAKVGAIAGVIAAIPLGLMMLFGFLFFAFAPSGAFPFGVGFLMMLVAVPMLLAWFVVLSAVGGYVGGFLYADRH